MALVSIIMNVRNGAAFLRDALNSVMAQTFQDWELIVWDDCSTDDSAKIVAEYRDPRIRYYLSPDDTPLGKARNAAIQKARGEWLAFLDQDDIWLPRKLEQQMALAGDGVGIIYGRTVMFDARGNRRDYDYRHEFSPAAGRRYFHPTFPRRVFHRHEFGRSTPIGSRRGGRHSRQHPAGAGLLPVHRDCAALFGKGGAAGSVPLSGAPGQHVQLQPAASA